MAFVLVAGGAAAQVSVSTGTGFHVTSRGHVLTNAHVVEGCTSITVSRPGVSGPIRANLLSRDTANDLALIQVPGSAITSPATLRRGVRIAEEVWVFGYPLSNIVAPTGNFTRGGVTALAGVKNDTTQFQLQAPIQPGNSGGPVLDSSANVVGVVVSKLKGQNDLVNFAIKSETAIAFLAAHQIDVAEAGKGAPLPSGEDIYRQATRFTILVTCIEQGNVSPPDKAPAQPQPSGIDVVRAFYTALGNGDGALASSLVVPEKRATGNFSAANLTQFWGTLPVRVRLIEVVPIGNDIFQVQYTYSSRSRTCNAAGVVTVVYRDRRPLIESVKTNC